MVEVHFIEKQIISRPRQFIIWVWHQRLIPIQWSEQTWLCGPRLCTCLKQWGCSCCLWCQVQLPLFSTVPGGGGGKPKTLVPFRDKQILMLVGSGHRHQVIVVNTSIGVVMPCWLRPSPLPSFHPMACSILFPMLSLLRPSLVGCS